MMNKKKILPLDDEQPGHWYSSAEIMSIIQYADDIARTEERLYANVLRVMDAIQTFIELVPILTPPPPEKPSKSDAQVLAQTKHRQQMAYLKRLAGEFQAAASKFHEFLSMSKPEVAGVQRNKNPDYITHFEQERAMIQDSIDNVLKHPETLPELHRKLLETSLDTDFADMIDGSKHRYRSRDIENILRSGAAVQALITKGAGRINAIMKVAEESNEGFSAIQKRYENFRKMFPSLLNA